MIVFGTHNFRMPPTAGGPAGPEPLEVEVALPSGPNTELDPDPFPELKLLTITRKSYFLLITYLKCI